MIKNSLIYKFIVVVFCIILLGETLIAQTENAVYISEFSASNKKVIVDEDAESSDWIEIYNPTKEVVNLLGWSLSDDSLNLHKWIFPNVEIGAGEFLVVFASIKDRRILGSNLHTNFRLESAGEYLALVDKNGEIISDYKPIFEKQYEDISYGVIQNKDTLNLVSTATLGKVLLPTNANWNQVELTWTGNSSPEPFDDSSWKSAYPAVGYDTRNGVSNINLALGKPSSQSSELNNGAFPASFATDGNSNNFTHTGDGDFFPWWEIDLEQSHFIDKLIIQNRKNCCQERLYNIVIEVLDSDDNILFESSVINSFAEGATPTSPGLQIEYTFNELPAKGISGQKVRIKKTLVSGVREYLSLAEVEIFGIDSYKSEILTDISEMNGKSTTAFMRFPFQVDDISNIDLLQLQIKYDDGFVAYLNGVEIASANNPINEITNTSTASQTHFAKNVENFSIATSYLKEGNNILAIVGLNNSIEDQSFLIKPQLTAFKIQSGGLGFFPAPTPGTVNNEAVKGFVADTKFDIDRGFFDDTFSLNITSETPGSSIIYTTDGSEPAAGNGIEVLAANDQTIPIVRIEISETTILRAAAFKNGLQSTNTDTQSYIYLDDIIASDVMRKSITEHSRYKTYMRQSLSDLPTLSLVIPPGTIEDEIDREASLEWIVPGSEEGFQENCGVRYYGGEWAGPFNKQNFRVYFRSKYGASKLKYPLFEGFEFGIPTSDKFDQLEIRAGSHDMVQRGFYMSNRFGDDTMLEMGNLNTHGRFVHLYFNGTYWGMYHLRERFNADWLAQYKGGNKEDYEAISGNKNIGGWAAEDRVYDGDGKAWETAKSLRENYDEIKEYVDLQAYIDFMLLYMFGNSENEYRAVGSTVPGVGFQFQLNDADGYLRNTGNRTAMGQPGQKHADGPGSIFSMLFKEGHPEYKILLADRIHKHFFNNGALTSYSISDRLGKRCSEVAIPFYAEAARWNYRTPDSWEAAKNAYFADVIPNRPATVLQYFKDAGFYPDLDAPLYYLNNEEKYGGSFIVGDELTLFKNTGDIYFTLDGSDPYNPVKDSVETESLFEKSAAKKAFVITSAIPENWNNLDYDDSGWKAGTGGVGFEKDTGYEAEIGINVVSMHDASTGCLIRIPFVVTESIKNRANKLLFQIGYDDGFVAYLNGTEIKRTNFSGDPVWDSKATASHEANSITTFDISSFIDDLKTGDNVLAIHGLNNSAGSTDFLISAELEAQITSDFEEQLTEKAALYDNLPIALDTAIVITARTYKDGIWSALSIATFTPSSLVDIQLTELPATSLTDIVCYPNPFESMVSIKLQSAIDSKILLEVYNTIGQKIYSTADFVTASQTKIFQIQTGDWTEGIYMYRIINTEGEHFTGKMIRGY